MDGYAMIYNDLSIHPSPGDSNWHERLKTTMLDHFVLGLWFHVQATILSSTFCFHHIGLHEFHIAFDAIIKEIIFYFRYFVVNVNKCHWILYSATVLISFLMSKNFLLCLYSLFYIKSCHVQSKTILLLHFIYFLV